MKFGNDSGWAFYSTLRKYAETVLIEPKNEVQLYEAVESFDTIIIGLHKPDKTPWDAYKFTENELKWLEHIAKKKKVILAVFTRPYAMLDVKNIAPIKAIVFAYQNSCDKLPFLFWQPILASRVSSFVLQHQEQCCLSLLV